jgi:hypothetical protein
LRAHADEFEDEFDGVQMDIEDADDIIEDLDGQLDAYDAVVADLISFAEDVTDESDADPAFCTQTARLAYVACGYDAADDFWTAQSNCTNVSDPIGHADCRHFAYEDFEETTEECEAVLEAREDVCGNLGESRFEVSIDPENFVNPADIGVTVDPNPYFPLVAGTMWTYEGDGEVIQVTVTEDVFEILDVPVVVVRDLVTEDGVEIEDTRDYYAQDLDGNVWYFGEIALNYEDGRIVDIDGSWTAGVDSAQPGILMFANPMTGLTYRQEYLVSEAEDVADIVDTEGSAVVPAAMCAGTCLVTRDYTPLEPGVTELKYYAPGVGMILETKAVEPEDEEDAGEDDGDEADDPDAEGEEEDGDEDEEETLIRIELTEFFTP